MRQDVCSRRAVSRSSKWCVRCVFRIPLPRSSGMQSVRSTRACCSTSPTYCSAMLHVWPRHDCVRSLRFTLRRRVTCSRTKFSCTTSVLQKRLATKVSASLPRRENRCGISPRPAHRRAARPFHAAHVGPRPRERLQHRRAVGRGRERARPLRRLRRDGHRGAVARRRARGLRRVRQRRRARHQPEPRQAPPHRRAGRAPRRRRYLATENRTYDLIFCDPPYPDYAELEPLLARYVPNLLAEDGLLVLETAAKTQPDLPLTQRTDRRYGAARITLWHT